MEVNDEKDDHVDISLSTYLRIDQPKSFFLFAGAGSGKTRSLVSALDQFRLSYGKYMQLHGKQIAVITYTNAACDEIKGRLNFDPIISVSTIHSFMWDLIQGFNSDIKVWLSNELKKDIDELEAQQKKGRAGTKAAVDRERSIQSKKRRLENLPTISKFIYSPTGDNRSRDSLNHTEVIKIGAHFLTSKPLMQKMLVGKFPFLLIDESQDTNKLLMDALFAIQSTYPKSFGLGLFGDTMQRIYSDGKPDLGKDLPEDWATPSKVMNHRCPRRVVQLINKVRSVVDNQQQEPRSDTIDGNVRLYISKSDVDKFSVEQQVRQKMAVTTKDDLWNYQDQVKTLILEHHMAAKRMNFYDMFFPLYQVDDFKTGLGDGTLSILRIFHEVILPLVGAKQANNEFAAMAIVRKWSPLLSMEAFRSAGNNQAEQITAAKNAVNELMQIFANGNEPKFIEILQVIAKNNLFEIPESLEPFLGDLPDEVDGENSEEDENLDKNLTAIRKFLDSPFKQVGEYIRYINGTAAFDTHQGVKGLEFPRVFVVIDDEDARGFLFSYEKLFGAKEKSETDLKHEQAGAETGIDRTRRLFYVTCSRAEESLAIMIYSSNPEKVRKHAIDQGWFDSHEVEVI